jgi:Flp pilus assembly protein TadD
MTAPTPRSPSVADAHARARALLEVRRWDDARRLLAESVARWPDDWVLWCLTAQCEIQSGHAEDALDPARRATVLRPTDEWPHRLSAISLRIRGDHAGARSAALEAVRLDPQDPAVHINLARTLVAAGDLEGAHRAAATAWRLDPASPRTHEAMGAVLFAMGRWTEAEGAYRRVVADEPENANALNELGRAVHRQGRDRDAVELYAAAARLNPREKVYRRNAAIAGRRVRNGRVAGGQLVILFIFGALATLGLGLGALTTVAMITGWAAVLLGTWAVQRARVGDLPAGVDEAIKDHLRERSRQRRTAIVALTITGVGFAVLALAGLLDEGAVAEAMAWTGIGLMVVGIAVGYTDRIRQRRAARR